MTSRTTSGASYTVVFHPNKGWKPPITYRTLITLATSTLTSSQLKSFKRHSSGSIETRSGGTGIRQVALLQSHRSGKLTGGLIEC
jgi:hypothetical protein